MPGTNRSGRRPQPSAIRALKGSRTRGNHKGEAVFTGSIPAMPDSVSKDTIASAKWSELAPRIAKAGVLTEAHGEMLALLCMSWADLERCREQLASMNNRQILVEETVLPDGTRRARVKANPLAQRVEKLAYQVARFLGEFGLTPMMSAKVSVEKTLQGDDPFAKFLTDDDPYSVS